MNAQSAQAIVIGASAGALDALTVILPALPGDFGLPVMVVVHVPPDKKSIMSEIFGTRCKMRVKEAEDKENIEPGTVYFAPPDYHLLVEADKSLSLSTEEPVIHSRPSIDVLFESAADTYGPGLIGIVLSGASEDGAAGLKAIIDAGGSGLVQDPEHAYASSMPLAALRVSPAAQSMSLQQIASYLTEAKGL